MQVIFVPVKMLLVLLLFNSQISSASINKFTIRDSQTGLAINAKVMVQLVDKNTLSFSQWNAIKIGNTKIDENRVIDSFTINHISAEEPKKYQLESAEYLQVLSISAKGYHDLQTYVEPQSKIHLTAIMLDQVNSQKKSSCQSASICGYVYDKDTLDPLKDVTLSLSNNAQQYSSQTNELGQFIFTEKIPENAVLSTSFNQYKTHIWNAISSQSAFSIIIDLEKGHGIIEKSMYHPLNDVLNNKIEKDWLQAKLSHVATGDASDELVTKERSTGAVYLEPPATIRVGFDGSGGTCCGSQCLTSQVYSLESYVQRGLDNEWISSWQSHSLKAGTIPYRSYGAWHVLNEVYTGYDICAGPCCQAFGDTSYTATTDAAIATNGIMLDKDGEIARSEYSAQNNSWDDPNDGLTCNNSDLSCGDGNVGSPATGWSCLADNSAGRGCFGHGRGMSQWGTQFHALDNETFAEIVDHYYNASNNPSGQRSQYASSPIRLDSIASSTGTVSSNEIFSIQYQVLNSSGLSGQFGPLLLGASLVNNSNSYSDPSNDFAVNLTQTGMNNLQRQFQIPANAAPGIYDLVATIYLDVNADNVIAGVDWRLVIITEQAAITILEDNDLIFKDSF